MTINVAVLGAKGRMGAETVKAIKIGRAHV